MAKNQFLRLRMAMFTSSAKRMSYELRENRAMWEREYRKASRKAKHARCRRFHRVCEYCMHTCYNELIVELEELLLQ